MRRPTHLRFADCELDLDAFELRRDGCACPVEPQVFELLAYLATNAGRLVTKDELIAKVWGGRIVSDAALASRLKSARKAIGDDGEQQRLIRTVHGRGVRFVAELDVPATPTADAPTPAPRGESSPAAESPPAAARAFGRSAEMKQLRAALAAALAGRRQTLFISGEAGVGKTTLVEAFARDIEAELGLRVGQGQCLELRGGGEAYMPVLEALGRLCQRPDGTQLVKLLRERAPSWLVQMPWLIPPAEQEALQRRTASNPRERMLREIVQVIELATAEKPLLLVLEDLHWSDPSTIDLVARLAQRRESARLFVIGTYRPAELRANDHPLRGVVQELRLRGLCDELTVPLLPESAIVEYLSDRFPQREFPSGFERLLYERTEGNPLFVAALIGTWLSHRLIIERDGRWVVEAPLATLATGVPDSLRQLVEQNLDRLEPEARTLLESGSVIGREFSAAVAAAAMERAEEDVDNAAAALVRQGVFLRDCGADEAPDTPAAPRYAFRHDLYREVLYDRIPSSRRRRLHLRIGTRLEEIYGAQAAERASELAAHFHRGRDPARAIHYGRAAADRALQRGAHGEAMALLRESLGALRRLDDEAQRGDLEFGLQIGRAAAAIAAQGYAADETEHAYRRAWQLSAGPTPDRRYFQAGYGLFVVRWNRAWLVEAASLAQELVDRAEAADDGRALCVAHRAVAVASNAIGDFARAREHAILALRSYDPERDRDSAAEFIHHIGVAALLHRAIADLHLGRADEAAATAATAVELARRVGHANSLAYALFFSAYLKVLAREADAAASLASELVAFADERFMEYWAATGRCALGAAAVIRGHHEAGRERLREGLKRLQAIHIAVFRPTFLGFLAEAEHGLGRREPALELLNDALEFVRTTQERWFEPGLQRLKAEFGA